MATKKITDKQLRNSRAGGALVGKRNGQTIVYSDGSLGGYAAGRMHSEGGIKGRVKGGGQEVEFQGNEVVITAPAVADTRKHEFNGQMLTNRQILSKINEAGGGVSFAKGGEVPKSIKVTGKKYSYGGKIATDHDIVAGCGCKHAQAEKGLAAGGKVAGDSLGEFLKGKELIGMAEFSNNKLVFEGVRYGTQAGDNRRGGTWYEIPAFEGQRSSYQAGWWGSREANMGVGGKERFTKNISLSNPYMYNWSGKGEGKSVLRLALRVLGAEKTNKLKRGITGTNAESAFSKLENAIADKLSAEGYDSVVLYDLTNKAVHPKQAFVFTSSMAAGGQVNKIKNPSNLSEHHAKLVRSKQFKDWFGDWENDKDNSSKVIDENGEPLLVYHATFKDFDISEIKTESSPDNSDDYIGVHFGTEQQAKDIIKQWADFYKRQKIEHKEPKIFEVFLNVRNLKRVSDQTTWHPEDYMHVFNEIGVEPTETIFVKFRTSGFKTVDRGIVKATLSKENIDGLVYKNSYESKDEGKDSYIVFNKRQISPATESSAVNNVSSELAAGGQVNPEIFVFTEAMKRKIESEFLSLSKARNYQGIYEFDEDHGLQMDWGKYGYSAIEDQQQEDLRFLHEAAKAFNLKNKGKLVAFAEEGDKFNSVYIMDLAQVANDDRKYRDISRYDKETFKLMQAADITNETVDKEIAVKSKKDAELARYVSQVKEASGFDITPDQVESMQSLGGTKMYNDFQAKTDSESFNEAPKFKTVDQLFEYVKTDKFINSFHASGGREAKALLYFHGGYINLSWDKNKSSYATSHPEQVLAFGPFKVPYVEYRTFKENYLALYEKFVAAYKVIVLGTGPKTEYKKSSLSSKAIKDILKKK